jgi:mxaK protein
MLFGAAAAVVALVTVGQVVYLQHVRQINAAIEDARDESHVEPEARLARAVVLAKSDYDGALAAYKALIQSGREDLRRTALYDLGNLHLQQALRVRGADDSQLLPLLELAKQSYRDELRRDPTDWDARYNLERALRLAPEDDDDNDADNGPPDPREHERSTIADPRMDLP